MPEHGHDVCPHCEHPLTGSEVTCPKCSRPLFGIAAKGTQSTDNSTVTIDNVAVPTYTPNSVDDIPSGRDDDVVARQLREAAMREPDPELREALWDEYRNYTGLSGGTDQ